MGPMTLFYLSVPYPVHLITRQIKLLLLLLLLLWYYFWLNISCGVAFIVRSYQINQNKFLRGGEGGGMFLRDRPIFEVIFNFYVSLIF